MSLAERQRRAIELYELRRRIDQEITDLEAAIDRDVRAMHRDRERAREALTTGIAAPSPAMREAHAAYNRGDRTMPVVTLEREYQVLAKKRRRAARRAA